MLKRKLLMTVLPLLTAGVLVGSGFSSWVFDNTGKTSDEQKGSVVLDGVDNNDTSITFNKITGLQLVLDQGGFDNLSNEDVGTYFRDSGSSTVTTLGGNATIDGLPSYTFKVTVQINANLNGWLEVDGNKDLLTYNGSKASKFTETSKDSGVYTATIESQTVTSANFSLDLANLINYTIKPTVEDNSTDEDYESLKTAVEAVKDAAAITIKAEVVFA